MNTTYAIIRKKRDGEELSSAEIEQVVGGYVASSVPDYQMAALLMAVYFRGLSERETGDLTAAMVASGDSVDLSALPGIAVDKHSTGGVGDKTTLVLAPLLAASGCLIAKMSGRGLGHTGGTLDKLEAIPGFRTDLSIEQLLRQAGEIGLAIVAQSAELAPADGLLYALRDVTATVDSLPLIASSIMSKKLAAGARAMVLDVKTGSGAFMREPDDAFALARAMVGIGRHAGRRVVAVVTGMEQPLGHAVGNSLEVAEAIATLRGGGPPDLRELCLALGSQLLSVALHGVSVEEARALLERALDDGAALERFRALVRAQGGVVAVADAPDQVLPPAPHTEALTAASSGYVAAVDALTVGEAARDLGAGRQQKGDTIDLAAGVVLAVKIGDALRAGQTWATIHAGDATKLRAARVRLERALALSATPVQPPRFLHGVVHPDGGETRFA
jgi:pyrimidine-nucleoside phosphorylase